MNRSMPQGLEAGPPYPPIPSSHGLSKSISGPFILVREALTAMSTIPLRSDEMTLVVYAALSKPECEGMNGEAGS